MRRSSTTVAVVARHPAVRAALRELLAAGGLEVVATGGVEEAGDLAELVDVVVADLEAGDVAEFEDDLDESGAAAVVLSDGGGARAGATAPRGSLGREAGADAIVAAARAVASGLTVTDAVGVPRGPEPLEPGTGEPSPLTDRERQVLMLIADGWPNKGIARHLGISEHTVKFHVGSVLQKLEAHSRAEAVSIAARRGYLPL